MDKSKAATKIHKSLLNTIPLAKGFWPWFYMGCWNMHGLCQFIILIIHIYIYMLRTQVFRLLCWVTLLLILNIPSEHQKFLTLQFSVQTQKTQILNINATGISSHTTSVFRACYHTMIFIAKLSIVPSYQVF